MNLKINNIIYILFKSVVLNIENILTHNKLAKLDFVKNTDPLIIEKHFE